VDDVNPQCVAMLSFYRLLSEVIQWNANKTNIKLPAISSFKFIFFILSAVTYTKPCQCNIYHRSA